MAGKTYLLLGRVGRPATLVGADRSAIAPGMVIRSGSEGMAISLGNQRLLKLLPKPMGTNPKLAPWGLYTNIPAHESLFGALRPPVGTKVLLPLTAYNRSGSSIPQQGDRFEFLVFLPPPASFEDSQPTDIRQRNWRLEVAHKLLQAAQAYADSTMARASAAHRTVVSGILTIRANLPPGEPDPIVFVRFLVDGQVVQLSNIPPFVCQWDTRQAPNGEHVVEVDALDKEGKVVTQTRALVVVENLPHLQEPSTPSSSPASGAP